MAKTHDEILNLGIELDAKDAIRAMDKFQRQLKNKFNAVTKAVDLLGKHNKKNIQEAVKDTKEWLDEVDGLAFAHDREVRELGKVVDQVEQLGIAHKNASGEAKKGIASQLTLLKKQARALSSSASAKLFNRAASNALQKNLAGGMKKGVEHMNSAMSTFFSKDLKGIAEQGSKGVGKILGFSLRKGAAGAFKAGGAMSARGSAMSDAGKQRGGASGAAMQGIGTALKGLGGLSGKVGGLLNTVGKMGPMLSVASTVMMSLIKLFIDAEVQAKQFQKEILSSASTSEYLAKSGGDADMAFQGLSETVKDIRNSAYSLQNLDWGITADEHKAVINSLTQEGVSLMRIEEEAKAANETVKDFASNLVHAGVAYSRALGVPIQEITELQSQMMTEMGASLKETKMGFARLTRSAMDSGMASNKFYGIIRGVSADLSLYTSRLDDAAKTLQLLSKVMNPREAAKFMQTATQGLKNMGRQDRLRMTLLTGTGKMSQLVKRDTESKARDLGEKIGMTSEQVLGKLNKEGAAGLEGAISKLPKESQAQYREMGIELQMQLKRAGKGTFGVSTASANLGPAGALEAMKDAVTRLSGQDKLIDAIGTIGGEMMAENLGISQEQLNAMAKFEVSIDTQRNVLKDQLAKGDKDTIDRLTKAGLKTAEDIDKAGYDQIYEAMDEGAKKAADDDGKIINYAQKQTELTQSNLDKLGVLVDFVTNQIYTVLGDIWESIEGLVETLSVKWFTSDEDKGKQRQKKKENDLKRRVMRGGSKDDMADLRAATGSDGHIDYLKYAQAGYARKPNANVEGAIAAESAAYFDGTDEERAKTKGGMQQVWGSAAMNGDPDVFRALVKREIEKSGGSVDMNALDTALKQNSNPMAALQGGDGAIGVSDSVYRNIGNEMLRTGALDSMPADQANQMLGAVGAPLATGATESAEGRKALETAADATTHTASATDELADAGARQKESLAVKFGPTFLGGKYKKTIEEAVLSALRTALFEFFMYSSLDPADVATYLNDSGTSIQNFAQQVGVAATQGKDAGSITNPSGEEGDKDKDAPKLGANAAGGLVTGVSGGLARVRAAAGEGLASVGAGERIVPAGAGGGVTIPIHVDGFGAHELAGMIRASTIDTVVEFKRRQRFAG